MAEQLIEMLIQLEKDMSFGYDVKDSMEEISNLVGIEYQEDYKEWREMLVRVCQEGIDGGVF